MRQREKVHLRVLTFAFLLLTFYLLPAALVPVGEKLSLTFVCQRMIEELIDYLEWHRSDVRANTRSFDDVNGMSQARGQHLGLPIVVVINFDNLTEEYEPILPNVVESPEEWTDETGACFGCKDRLRSREA